MATASGDQAQCRLEAAVRHEVGPTRLALATRLKSLADHREHPLIGSSRTSSADAHGFCLSTKRGDHRRDRSVQSFSVSLAATDLHQDCRDLVLAELKVRLEHS